MPALLPDGFIVRPPILDDLKAVTELLRICDINEYGEPETTEEDLRTRWQAPGTNLTTDAWLIFTPAGQLVGYTSVRNRQNVHFFFAPKVHPQYIAYGLSTYLIEKAEERACQHVTGAPSDARITINTWMNSTNAPLRTLIERKGYALIRSDWKMEIEMDQAPQTVVWPEGIVVKTFVLGKDERATFEAGEEAFRDHWGHMPGNFENWKHWMFKRNFDPSLWFLAWNGDQIAGSSLCESEQKLGWVDNLSVRRPWRRKGLGLALLHHTFNEFYKRGIYKVGLDVDTQNLTGATRLYHRAGMHIALQRDNYEKELRAGRELSTQAITA